MRERVGQKKVFEGIVSKFDEKHQLRDPRSSGDPNIYINIRKPHIGIS